MINVGDRVQWQQQPPRHTYKGKVLTGIVRDIKYQDGIKYAVVATDPDQRLTMPSLDKLEKVEKPTP
jgi:hypothetical protein